MLRILLVAPDSNPDGTHAALIGFSHSEALARRHAVTLVVHRDNADAVRRNSRAFHGLEVVSLPRLDAIYAWCFRWIFKGRYDSQLLTAFNYFFRLAFEWQAWRQTRGRIMAGEFDVVLRLLPIPAVLPSVFGFFLRHGPIPFVVGPINGGLPWPRGFSQASRAKEWISNLRSLYRFLPFVASTYRNAAAIIAGSSQTFNEFAAYREKLFFVPGENGIDPAAYPSALRSSQRSDNLELIFVGGLSPVKAVDLALQAAAPLLKSGRARFTIVGDGPERARLEQLTGSLEVERAVSFCGWVSHPQVIEHLAAADVLVFPSVREFGGAVVFEALAMGAIPVVADFGGPGDIVIPDVGFKVTLTNENDVVAQIARVLAELARDPDLVERLRRQGMRYARERLTWDGKAETVTQILHWAVRRGPKPDLRPANAQAAKDWHPSAVPIDNRSYGTRHTAAPTITTSTNDSVRRCETVTASAPKAQLGEQRAF